MLFRSGDIIVGKITPKGESDPSPEEKLLKAIFGDKAGDVKDASLKATPSLSGVVIGKNLYKKALKDRKQKLEDRETMAKLDAQFQAKAEQLKTMLVEKLVVLLKKHVSAGVKDYVNTDIVAKGLEFTAERLQQIDYMSVMLANWTDDEHTNDLVCRCIMNYIAKHKEMDAALKREKFNLTIGDELPNGIIEMAKVYIAKRRKIRVGD